MQLMLAENRFVFWMLTALSNIDGVTILTWFMEILVSANSLRSLWTQHFDLTTDLLFHLFISRHTHIHPDVPYLDLFGAAKYSTLHL